MDADLSRAAVISRIRKGLQTRTGRTWSVTGGRGTAWGWIRISAPPARKVCFDKACDRVACTHGRYEMTEDDLAMLSLALGERMVHHQGVSIPASSAYYREFIDRAEGRTPEVIGTPYWD